MNIIPVFFSGETAYFLLSKIFCRNTLVKYEILCGYDNEIENLPHSRKVIIEDYKFIILTSNHIGEEFETLENSIIKRVPVFISFSEAGKNLDLHLRNVIDIFLGDRYF